MPLNTSITDYYTGVRRSLPNGWGWWHVEMMLEAAHASRSDRGTEPCTWNGVYAWSDLCQQNARDRNLPPIEVEWALCNFVMTHDWGVCDLDDKEELFLHVGDTLTMTG